MHWAPAAITAAAKAKVDCFKCDAVYSPDTNYVENIFGIAEERLNKVQAKKRAKTVKEHEARFEKVMKEIAEDGTLKKTMKTMPQRCKDIIAAEGGPTKW